jgi:hypothetical protein
MPFPFGPLPTLREFLEEVVAKHGCQVIDVEGVIGPHGPIDRRCLLGPSPSRIPYPLPAMLETHFMKPALIGSIGRTLGIKTGFPSV